MAKVVVTFEDITDGVNVQVVSDPPFPENPNDSDPESLTDAQHMGLRMTQMLSEEMGDHNHECGHHQCCGGHHDHGGES